MCSTEISIDDSSWKELPVSCQVLDSTWRFEGRSNYLYIENAPSPRAYYRAFRLHIYPNMTPIYYSSFHFLFHDPNITQYNPNIL